jgi:hypothetical protein
MDTQQISKALLSTAGLKVGMKIKRIKDSDILIKGNIYTIVEISGSDEVVVSGEAKELLRQDDDYKFDIKRFERISSEDFIEEWEDG